MLKTKSKPCVGIGKAKGQKGCGKETIYRRYGLCQSCYADFILNTDAGKILLEKATLKATKPRRELEKAVAEKKNRDKLITHLESTKTIVHEYVRKRDKDKPCISCNTPYKSNFQAGHYYKAELFTSLKFNFDNIHGQCEKCNLRLEGNLNQYELNLPKRIGEQRFNELKKKAELDHRTIKKWSREELKAIRLKARKLIKELCQ
ncbi:recombination protein NinG [Joostella sp. CR20]|uniref:recombination protein NinG n=1 Tax=Joostella sp. CR20 TaxID=2804312 RepID=UPI00313DFA42